MQIHAKTNPCKEKEKKREKEREYKKKEKREKREIVCYTYQSWSFEGLRCRAFSRIARALVVEPVWMER